jgi:ATP-binding cassette subfamily B protein
MVGHRTRLAQEPRATWHDAEDDQLSGYADRSFALDRVSVTIAALPRAWIVAGLLSLAPAFLDPHQSGAALAVGLGGVVLAYRALTSLTASTGALFGAQRFPGTESTELRGLSSA